MGRPSKMNVTSIMPSQKKDKSPTQMALGHPHQQHSFQSQQPQSLVLMGQNHSPQSSYYVNHQLGQMPGGSGDRQHGYLGEMHRVQNMKMDQLPPGFSSKFIDEMEDHRSRMSIPCDQDGRPLVSYQGQNLSQPLNYMMEDKQQDNKSFYGNGIDNGPAFTSTLSNPWHGDLNQARQRQPDDYCDTKVKMEQENASLFYYLNHHPGGSNSASGMQSGFDASIDWTDELAYRQGDVLSDFAQPLHHSSGSPSSMTDEIFNNGSGGTAEQHSSVEGPENHLGLFAFDGGLENFAGSFDSLQSLSAFPSHVPSSSNVLDLKSMMSTHHPHQPQNFQDIFGPSGLAMTSQDVQEVLESADKTSNLPFVGLDSLESLVKNAESLVHEAASRSVDSKHKWCQTLQEASRQFRLDEDDRDFSEDDPSKAEKDFRVEEGCFEDGSRYEVLASRSRQYWRSLVLPKSDTHWMGEYSNACPDIIVPYKKFVAEMTALNRRLAAEFSVSFESVLLLSESSVANEPRKSIKLLASGFEMTKLLFWRIGTF